MKDWTKIQVFDRIYQAELCKDILEKNGIEAFIINARDSLFLIGEIELYVKDAEEAKAKALIDEFDGLTKINSFIMPRPMENFKKYLEQHGIEVIVKKKEDSEYILENYEIYIKNEDLDRAIPILRGEKLEGWVKIDSYNHTRQMKFRIEILEEKKIESIVIKKKDSNYHLEEVQVWVEEKNVEVATKLINQLNGWIKIETYDQLHRAEIREDFLGKHAIRSIIRKENSTAYELYVECHNEERSIELINEYKNWIKVDSFETIVEAEFCKEMLEENNVNAVIINRKDSSFLVGEIDLYVDEDSVEKAKNLILDYEKQEQSETQIEE